MEDPVENPQEELKDLDLKNIFYTISPIVTAFTALFGIFFLYQFGGAIVTLAIFGFNFEKADVNAMRLLTMGGQVLFMLFPTLVLARYVYPLHLTQIFRVKFPSLKEVGIFLGGMLILTPLLQNFLIIQNFLIQQAASKAPFIKNMTDFLDQFDKVVEKTYESLLRAQSAPEVLLVIVVVAVVPSLCEEFLFRGLAQKSFEQKYKPFLSILITSLFFGLYHFNPYGLIALITLGMYFGYAAYVSNSIFIPIILHFTNNFLAVLAFLTLGNEELLKSNPKVTGSILSYVITFIIFLSLFILFLVYVKNNYKKLTVKENQP